MSTQIATITFTKEVPVADADGTAILEGSVLREVNDGDREVVTWVGWKDAKQGPGFASVGDLCIKTGVGSSRITNRYDQWRHVPHDEQTYAERHLSWLIRPFDPHLHEGVSEREAVAIAGIMALLPSNAVDWDYGPFPDRIEDALGFLTAHLTEISTKPA